MPERPFLWGSRVPLIGLDVIWDESGYGKKMGTLTRQPFKARTTEELMALLSAVGVEDQRLAASRLEKPCSGSCVIFSINDGA